MYDSIDLLTDLTQNFHECTPQHTNASIFNSESYRSLNSFPFAVFSVLNYSLPSRSGSQHRFYYRRRAETALPCALPNFRPHQSNEKKKKKKSGQTHQPLAVLLFLEQSAFAVRSILYRLLVLLLLVCMLCMLPNPSVLYTEVVFRISAVTAATCLTQFRGSR